MAGKTQLSERLKMARDPRLRARVQAQLVAVALDVAGELATTPHRDERHELAVAVLRNAAAYESRFTHAVVMAATSWAIVGPNRNAADAALGTAIAAVWNDMAGVKAP